MFEDKIRKIIKPVIEEVYAKGFEDGARHTTRMFVAGMEKGHADTMAMLGAIDIEQVDDDVARAMMEVAE